MAHDSAKKGAFNDLLTRFVRTPKHEIDGQEQKYREEREESFREAHASRAGSDTPAPP